MLLSFELVFIYIAFYVFTSRDLHNNNISQLPENVFSGLRRLFSLFLQNNKITFLTNGRFSKLENLEYLLLSGNNFQEIPDGAFRNSKYLRQILLSDNPINTVGERVFTIQNQKISIFMIRTKLRTFDLASFDNSKNIPPAVITLRGGKIDTIKCNEYCVVHL
ncbi:leucine-rich repeat-containing protein 15-like [Montipora capricornis]|uniref:leucine-rich repeat-containing protein 15-like n=1 Tax=Montipora capricornis TaxID=246305 RepID=UPI0035F16635